MFKLQISLDRHNAGLKFNYCLRFDPHHFSLPSTLKKLLLPFLTMSTQTANGPDEFFQKERTIKRLAVPINETILPLLKSPTLNSSSFLFERVNSGSGKTWKIVSEPTGTNLWDTCHSCWESPSTASWPESRGPSVAAAHSRPHSATPSCCCCCCCYCCCCWWEWAWWRCGRSAAAAQHDRLWARCRLLSWPPREEDDIF